MSDSGHCLATRSLDVAVGDEAPVPSGSTAHAVQKVQGQEIRRTDHSGGGAVAAPAPPAWLVADAGTHGVQRDVPAALEQLSVGEDRDRAVPALEDMAGSVISLVETLRVGPVQVAHACSSRRSRGLDQEVEEVAQYAVRVASPREPLDRPRQQLPPGGVIELVQVQGRLGESARVDVEKAADNLGSRSPRHAETVRCERAERNRRTDVVTDPGQLSRDQVPRRCLAETRPGTRSRDIAVKDTRV